MDIALEGPQLEYCGHLQGGGEGVVGGLMQVDVSQGTDPRIVAGQEPQQLQGPVGQHLIDVHVGRGSGPPLQGIDANMAVEPSLHHLLAGRFNRLGLCLIPLAKLSIGPGAGQLDRPEGMDQGRRDGALSQRKVFQRPKGVDAVERPGGDVQFAQKIFFFAI